MNSAQTNKLHWRKLSSCTPLGIPAFTISLTPNKWPSACFTNSCNHTGKMNIYIQLLTSYFSQVSWEGVWKKHKHETVELGNREGLASQHISQPWHQIKKLSEWMTMCIFVGGEVALSFKQTHTDYKLLEWHRHSLYTFKKKSNQLLPPWNNNYMIWLPLVCWKPGISSQGPCI